MRLFLLRLLSFAIPFALVIGGVWFLPMVNGRQVTKTSIGPPYAFGIDERNPFDKTVTWKTTVELTATPTYVLPRLPFRFSAESGSNPGGTTLNLDQWVFFNGQEAYRMGGGWEMGTHGGGERAVSEGYPLDIDDVHKESFSLLHKGTNDIEVRARVSRDGGTAGTGQYSITLGPVNMEVIRADVDHDGVRDDKQPFPGVHTGSVAVPLALVAGGLGFVVVRRRKRKEPPV
jgi:hypothetical protein